MSTPAAVRHLRNDLHRLHRAEHTRDRIGREVRKDEKKLTQDRRHVDHVRDAFEDNKKELKGDRRDLSRLRAKEDKRMDQFESKEADLQAQYDASIDPLTGQGNPFIKLQLDGLQQRQADVQARFDARIDDKRDDIEKNRNAMQRQRAEIKDTRHDIKGERRELKKERHALDRARERVKDRRHAALEDLRPAEYKMGLKATNRVRRDLGLKPVDHVIRPDRGPGDVSGVSGAGLGGLNAKTEWAAKVARKMGLTVTSTTGGTHAPGSYHYSGRAVDVAGPASTMAKFYRFMAQKSPTELFYDPIGGIKNGVQIGAIGGHSDHVHVAF